MSQFDDRRDAYENKFAHDEQLRFKATARRNKALGLWAAELLGRSGADAQTYAKTVVMADFEEVGDNDVLRKVAGDLAAGGVEMSEAAVRAKMNELLAAAVTEIETGG